MPKSATKKEADAIIGNIGSNVKTVVQGNKLTIEIDLSKKLGLSSSGKSNNIASSKGNHEIDGTDGIKLGVNCYKPVK